MVTAGSGPFQVGGPGRAEGITHLLTPHVQQKLGGIPIHIHRRQGKAGRGHLGSRAKKSIPDGRRPLELYQYLGGNAQGLGLRGAPGPGVPGGVHIGGQIGFKKAVHQTVKAEEAAEVLQGGLPGTVGQGIASGQSLAKEGQYLCGPDPVELGPHPPQDQSGAVVGHLGQPAVKGQRLAFGLKLQTIDQPFGLAAGGFGYGSTPIGGAEDGVHLHIKFIEQGDDIVQRRILPSQFLVQGLEFGLQLLHDLAGFGGAQDRCVGGQAGGGVFHQGLALEQIPRAGGLGAGRVVGLS